MVLLRWRESLYQGLDFVSLGLFLWLVRGAKVLSVVVRFCSNSKIAFSSEFVSHSRSSSTTSLGSKWVDKRCCFWISLGK